MHFVREHKEEDGVSVKEQCGQNKRLELPSSEAPTSTEHKAAARVQLQPSNKNGKIRAYQKAKKQRSKPSSFGALNVQAHVGAVLAHALELTSWTSGIRTSSCCSPCALFSFSAAVCGGVVFIAVWWKGGEELS